MSSSRFLKAVACFIVLVAASVCGTVQAQVVKVTVDLVGVPAGTSLSTRMALQNAFLDAERFWESRLIGFSNQLPAPVLRTIKEIEIDASIEVVDGSGGILGFAQTTRFLTYDGGRRPYEMPQEGRMVFDVADAVDFHNLGLFDDIVRHEMAHVLGFSANTWSRNRLNLGPNNNFTGAFALKRYRLEAKQPSALFVPVEQAGGAGTALSHWDSSNPFFFNATRNSGELMIGFITDAPRVSETTWASFADVGYKVRGVNDKLTIPVPGGGDRRTVPQGTRTTTAN
jgi:hypothetical protein